MSSVTRMVRLGCVVVALAACGSGNKHRQMTTQEMIAADPIPVAKGAKWTYQVRLKKCDPERNKGTTKQLSWTTEVVDAREQNGVTAYRVKGWPTDLAAFDNIDAAPAPTERTLLRSGNTFLFGKYPEPVVDEAEGWFSWPVIDGQRICPRAEMNYCWEVAAVETGYALTFLTGPDEQTFEIEPGTGVSRFHYAHHGTTNEVDAKLTGYTKGKGR